MSLMDFLNAVCKCIDDTRSPAAQDRLDARRGWNWVSDADKARDRRQQEMLTDAHCEAIGYGLQIRRGMSLYTEAGLESGQSLVIDKVEDGKALIIVSGQPQWFYINDLLRAIEDASGGKYAFVNRPDKSHWCDFTRKEWGGECGAKASCECVEECEQLGQCSWLIDCRKRGIECQWAGRPPETADCVVALGFRAERVLKESAGGAATRLVR